MPAAVTTVEARRAPLAALAGVASLTDAAPLVGALAVAATAAGAHEAAVVAAIPRLALATAVAAVPAPRAPVWADRPHRLAALAGVATRAGVAHADTPPLRGLHTPRAIALHVEVTEERGVRDLRAWGAARPPMPRHGTRRARCSSQGTCGASAASSVALSGGAASDVTYAWCLSRAMAPMSTLQASPLYPRSQRHPPSTQTP